MVFVTVKLLLGGDKKFQYAVLGHKGDSSLYSFPVEIMKFNSIVGACSINYCAVCTEKKATMGDWDPSLRLPPRESFVPGEDSVALPALLKSIKPCDVLEPVVHALIGITKKLWRALIRVASKDSRQVSSKIIAPKSYKLSDIRQGGKRRWERSRRRSTSSTMSWRTSNAPLSTSRFEEV